MFNTGFQVPGAPSWNLMKAREAEHQLDQRAAASMCRQTIILWTD